MPHYPANHISAHESFPIHNADASTLAYPLRVLSDLHFRDGHSPLTERSQLRGLFKGAGTVILNGDSVEERQRPRWVAQIDMDEVQAAARDEGVALIVVSGNHDPSLSPIRQVRLVGLNLTIKHGDGCREGEPNFRPLTHHARVSWHTLRIACRLWWGFHRRHLAGLQGNLIVGHSHRPGLWRNSSGVLVNLGGHSPLPWAYAIEIGGRDDPEWAWRPIRYAGRQPLFTAAKRVRAIGMDRPAPRTISSHGQIISLGAQHP